METLNYVASIFGLSFIVVPLALLVNSKQLEKVVSHLEKEFDSFCWGVASLVLGLAMVLNHSVWQSDWTVIITILGWVALIKGLALLFVPEKAMDWEMKMLRSKSLSTWLVVLVFLGLVLTYYGFTA